MFEKINNYLLNLFKYKYKVAAILFVFLSLVFLLATLIGSINGSVYLNQFTFSEPVNKLLQKNSITFTLLGFCVDDNCTQQVSHNFDKGKNLKKKHNSVYLWNILINCF